MKNLEKEIIFTIFAIKKNFESSMELRGSFLLNLFGMMINNSAFIIIWMTFGALSKGMGGWQPIDVLGMLGFGTIGYGLCFAFFGGISDLPEIVSGGSFDKYLLSPKNIILRLSVSTIRPSAIGDLLFGVVTLVFWFIFTGVTFEKVIFAILFSIISSLIYFFFSVFVNSFAFWFYDSRSVVQGFFEFLITPSIFYGGAFQGIMRFFFIFIIPALLLGTVPIEAIKELNYWKLVLSIVLTVLWGIVSILFFNKSVKRYESTSFINFG